MIYSFNAEYTFSFFLSGIWVLPAIEHLPSITWKSTCRCKTTALICALDIIKMGCQTTCIRYLKMHQKDIWNTGTLQFMSPTYLLIRRCVAGFCFKYSIHKFTWLGIYFKSLNKHKIYTYWGIFETRVILIEDYLHAN